MNKQTNPSTGFRDWYFHLIFIIVIILFGGWLRLWGLDRVPGLEHDEALICLGAASIVETGDLTLTGDKVYEGPLLELIIGNTMKNLGTHVSTARGVMCFSGLLTLIVIYLTGCVLYGPWTGFASAITVASFPWALATSRVIYACNLTPLFLSLHILMMVLFLKYFRNITLAGAGIFLGLVMHGRITAVMLLIPSLIIIAWKMPKQRIFIRFTLFLLPMIILNLPVVIYNFLNGWPALSVFAGQGQGHFAGSNSGGITMLMDRVVAMARTILEAMNGGRFWLDFVADTRNWAMPIVFIAGLILFLANYRKTNSRICAWIGSSLIFVFILVSMTTKTLNTHGSILMFHPHYMDLVFPFLWMGLFAFFHFIFREPQVLIRRNFVGVLIILAITGSQLIFLQSEIVKPYGKTGGPGRWKNDYEQRFREISGNYHPDDTVIVQPWMFGRGYPQAKFLLPEFTVIPYLRLFPGLPGPGSRRVVTVSDDSILDPLIWSWKSESRNYVSDHSRDLGILETISPSIYVRGTFSCGDSGPVDVNIQSQMRFDNRWSGNAEIILPGSGKRIGLEIENRKDFHYEVPAIAALIPKVTPRHRQTLKALSLYPVGHEITGRTDAGLPVTLSWLAEESGYRVNLEYADSSGSGEWSGTVNFY